MDRRIRKTREAILGAFVGLMAEKDFEHITINEIAERADVNRGTVYLHYVDKFDLLDQCIEEHLRRLFESCFDDSAHFPSKSSLLGAFEYLEQNASLYATLLVDRGVPAFRKRLMTVLRQAIDDFIVVRGGNRDLDKDLLVQFLSSAIVGVLEWWVTESMPYPAVDMVEKLWVLLDRMQVITKYE